MTQTLLIKKQKAKERSKRRYNTVEGKKYMQEYNKKPEIKEYNKKYGIEYRKKHKKKMSIYNKKYQQKNPEKILESRRKRLENLGLIFNMSGIDYDYALQAWSRSVKNRDKQCKVCNSKHNLEAHHIKSKVKHVKLSLDTDNGVTLCKDCHHEFTYGVCK